MTPLIITALAVFWFLGLLFALSLCRAAARQPDPYQEQEQEQEQEQDPQLTPSLPIQPS